ncbi:hypothetical protein ACFCW2_04160 [Qipengyuania sp. DSG2-2]|uniref:hypothetical protein n=1 Tax=Qipengyuania sp. DGS2-2 TaxID=3349631 RepID=UPI0036D27686
MKNPTRLALAAPLALALAACGGGADADERVVDDGLTEGVDVDVPEVDVEYPEVSVDARGTVNYQRTYTNTDAAGGTSTITLGADDSYTMTKADGTETSGTFNWYSDNSRILIREDGTSMVFGVADGALYRLADENADPNGPRTPENTFTAPAL